jgi:folate-dependent phosphoribosylglycinamide formyltransferase PurN
MDFRIAVLDADMVESRSARILTGEHRIYSHAIAIVLARRWRIEGRRVVED